MKQLISDETNRLMLNPWLIEGNGYETRQISLLYVFVLFFGLDRAQNEIVVYSVLSLELGSLRNHDGYGDENVTSKYKF